MSIYKVIIDMVEQHSRFDDGSCSDLLRFDLDRKTIKNGKNIIMKEGVIYEKELMLKNGTSYNLKLPLMATTDLEEVGIKDCSQSPYEVIEKLYENYKYSVQSERSHFLKQNFYAVKNDDLSFNQLLNNMARTKAQYMLESYIIFASISKWITWENEKHFFKEMNDKDLLIYKSWIQ